MKGEEHGHPYGACACSSDGVGAPYTVPARLASRGLESAQCLQAVAGTGLRRRRDARPNATRRCETATYVLLVYGRLNLEAVIASGRLVVNGGRGLAGSFTQWCRGI
jgi:hypothetical protein